MSDDTDFEPRLGKMRAPSAKRARKYLGRVLAATNLARGGAAVSGSRTAVFSGSRIGRGAGVGRLLGARGARTAFGARRVVIKASIVKLAGKGATGAAAHLRYLQRDGTTRGGEPGRLYGAEADQIDGKSFRARGAGDRHQFRFIVSAEDGADYEDLKPLTRRLMTRMEEDLGTKLDWVAVDHFNTGHPHTHIVVRGKDHLGDDLVIARDYLTAGLRERACALVDLDLGPRTRREIEVGLRAEVGQERLTSLDRAMLRETGADGIVSTVTGDASHQTLRAGRLAKLRQMGLAEPIGGSRWRLSEGMSDTLLRMGERGDIIRTMQREFASRGIARAPVDQTIYDPRAPGTKPLIGKVVGRGLADEHADRHYLLVDGIDGRSHYVALGRGSELEATPEGAAVRISPRTAEVRRVDHMIAEVAAANGGRYDIEAHLRHDPNATESFAETHVRRLEAMRRLTQGVDREPSGQWIIADDHLARAKAHEERVLRDRPVALEILSPRPLSALVEVGAASWIDRDLVAGENLPLRDAGFGAEVRAAQQRRQQWLIAQDLAVQEEDGVRYRSGLIGTLQQRELSQAAAQIAATSGLRFSDPEPGARIEGVLRRRLDLISGRFALIENSREFALVPWRPILERQIGKPVSGILRDDRVSWSFGRERQGPSIP